MFKKKKDKVYDFLPIYEKALEFKKLANKYKCEGDIYNQIKEEIKAEYYMKGASEMYHIFTNENLNEEVETCNLENND